MTIETPKEKFLRFCPGGFSDPSYLRFERDYKWAAHETWQELLNETEFDRLLSAEDHGEVCRRAVRVEGKTKLMLTRYEKAALHDALRQEGPAKLFAHGLYDLVYGEDNFEKRFVEFGTDLASLPRVQTSPIKWTIATIFPFVAKSRSQNLIAHFAKPLISQALPCSCQGVLGPALSLRCICF